MLVRESAPFVSSDVFIVSSRCVWRIFCHFLTADRISMLLSFRRVQHTDCRARYRHRAQTFASRQKRIFHSKFVSSIVCTTFETTKNGQQSRFHTRGTRCLIFIKITFIRFSNCKWKRNFSQTIPFSILYIDETRRCLKSLRKQVKINNVELIDE